MPINTLNILVFIGKEDYLFRTVGYIIHCLD
jgi:hypothetical protein